eukprot:TRINITY_DN66911_c0_g1_i1.p1 TRINITY_DN66911_c0_g1~~TRINITY_DN66911_c0_g1_i1.p1  ORF type:complete len:439 (-),score=74.31 TRINITY_DN66911_c0_g1_i1:18-1256(-)
MSDRDVAIKTSLRWISGRVKDDNCEGLWRIHDQLYDLSDFKHPGGSAWIELTKGTDITEAFETMHVQDISPKLVEKYKVKPAIGPRNYRYTFKEDGFYKTLKRKVQPILKQSGTGPSFQSKFFQDMLALGFISLFITLCKFPSSSLAILTGLVLGMSTSCAHNFFHQADKKAWRRFYFDLSLLSHRDWRISHAISHHLYTNSFSDIEVTALEPFINFLPAKKNFIQHTLSHFYVYFGIFISFPFEFIKRTVLVVSGEQELLIENLLPILQLSLLLFFNDVFTSIFLWLLFHSTSGFWLIVTSVTTTHHHPELYHAGDVPREDTDWGFHQVDTVRDVEKKNLAVVLTTFGDHLLHHLFPSVDHSKLAQLYPALYETCKEFQEVYSFKFVPEMILGMHQRIANTKPTSFVKKLN